MPRVAPTRDFFKSYKLPPAGFEPAAYGLGTSVDFAQHIFVSLYLIWLYVKNAGKCQVGNRGKSSTIGWHFRGTTGFLVDVFIVAQTEVAIRQWFSTKPTVSTYGLKVLRSWRRDTSVLLSSALFACSWPRRRDVSPVLRFRPEVVFRASLPSAAHVGPFSRRHFPRQNPDENPTKSREIVREIGPPVG